MMRGTTFRSGCVVVSMAGALGAAIAAHAANPVCTLRDGGYASVGSQAQCPMYRHAAGGGFMAAVPHSAHSLLFPPDSPAEYGVGGTNVEAEVVCCDNLYPGQTSAHGTGSALATCGWGTIAVGGGGHCDLDGAVLTESRPVGGGSSGGGSGGIGGGAGTPTAWRASCSTGGVTAYANCISPTPVGGPTLTSCQIIMSTASSSPTWVNCPAGQIAMAAGTTCYGGSYPTFAWIQQYTTSQTYSECSAGTALTGFAICCNGTRSP